MIGFAVLRLLQSGSRVSVLFIGQNDKKFTGGIASN
jgi:hypothetical protein